MLICGPCWQKDRLAPGQETPAHPDASDPGRERGETLRMTEEEAVDDRTLIMPFMALSVDLLISFLHICRCMKCLILIDYHSPK